MVFVQAIVWGPIKAIGIGEWSICGGGRLERVYCICRSDGHGKQCVKVCRGGDGVAAVQDDSVGG